MRTTSSHSQIEIAYIRVTCKAKKKKMQKSNLKPYTRTNLDILFVGLNPAKGSSENGHYFSVKQSFWNQLYKSGLITEQIDKLIADDVVFGSTEINTNKWNYGITNLITEVAESDSRKINPTNQDCIKLDKLIKEIKPLSVVFLHGKVLKNITKYLNINKPNANSGKMGKIINGSNTVFYNIAFPHGNAIADELKIEKYKELKEFILSSKL